MSLTVGECKRVISEARKQLTAAKERMAELESLVLAWRELALQGAGSVEDWDRAQAGLESRMASIGLRWKETERWGT